MHRKCPVLKGMARSFERRLSVLATRQLTLKMLELLDFHHNCVKTNLLKKYVSMPFLKIYFTKVALSFTQATDSKPSSFAFA
ncbi:hypothetical protein XELAEV_18005445mg [Xenopus laevis]|uniref:Uncharacterized protein n=1 Tax=Xenopus laevis TaxID=8355 RepID=A0A974I2L3_XENLA|nr:hypothetical protein XELAEV_18005445mg [Xenopus laevis]